MSKRVRVRFAPSPTGNLHIGGARTAIFNLILARSLQGEFLVRIEDTDKARSKDEFLNSIINSLNWLGIQSDEPLFMQSRNLKAHKESVDRLLKTGCAYRCFCSPEMLVEKREASQKLKKPTLYDGTCRKLTDVAIQKKLSVDEKFSVRCQVPEGETVFDDLIHGETRFQNCEIDDFVIMRQDGTPTYMLAVVVDDHDMEISHVIRGDDHLSNTPKQVILYNHLKWELPQFGHMPMILGPDKARLSKRHGAISVELYRERGYLPDAVKNYLALLGWSPGDDREILTFDEIIDCYKIENSQKKAAVFDEQKLQWINSQYLSVISDKELEEHLEPYIAADPNFVQSYNDVDPDYRRKVIALTKPRMKLLSDFLIYGAYYFCDPVMYDPDAVKKHWKAEETVERLARLRLALQNDDVFNEESTEAVVRSLAEELEISAAKLIHPLRLALTGYGVSPGIFEVMVLLGKEICIRRIEKAVDHLQGTS